MATFFWSVPDTLRPKINDETGAAVEQYLASNGIPGAVVGFVGDPFRMVIQAGNDPTALLNAYTGQPTANRDTYEKAKTVVETYLQNFNPATATNDQKGIAAVMTILKRGGWNL